MADIPTTEPLEVRAGDTWAWRREDLTADYPAGTWTLVYTFINATQKFSVTASADGTNFAVTVAAATTATKIAGEYTWIARVSAAGEVHTVDQGNITLLPDIGTAVGYDGRTHARKVLDAIEAVMENRASLDQQSISIAGRTLARTPIAELISLRTLYRSEVKREESAARLAAGLDSRRHIGVRFERG